MLHNIELALTITRRQWSRYWTHHNNGTKCVSSHKRLHQNVQKVEGRTVTWNISNVLSDEYNQHEKTSLQEGGSQWLTTVYEPTPDHTTPALGNERVNYWQDCIYCIILQIKLHICQMLGRLVHNVHNVHNALLSIPDSPIIVLTLCKCHSHSGCQEWSNHAHQ